MAQPSIMILLPMASTNINNKSFLKVLINYYVSRPIKIAPIVF